MPEGTYAVYFTDAEEVKLGYEEAQPKEALEDATGELTVKSLLAVMQTDPENKAYKCALPANVKVLDFDIIDGQLVLNFDVAYKDMSKNAEVLCRAALVKTMCQVPGVENVQILIEGEPLTDDAGIAIGHMTEDSFVDNAGDDLASYERADLTLYFANEAGDGLVVRNVECVYNSNICMDRLVVEQIVKGPQAEAESVDCYPTVAADTLINSVTTRDGICYVNLGNGFLAHEYNVTPQVTIYSIVDSLTELADVNKVQISVEGNTEINYMESIPLSQIFERNLEIVEEAHK